MRIAIPNKGRMSQSAKKLLKDAGLKLLDDDERSLFIKTSDADIDVISVRADDIPEYVQTRAADLGITGRDLVLEKNAKVKQLLQLNFGYCSMVLAAPEKGGIKSVNDLQKGSKIATKFPNSAKKYFRQKKKQVEIVEISGAAEITPIIGVADAIIDITSTGTTMKTHGLKLIDTLFESSAILIANRQAVKEDREKIDDILLALEGVVAAEKKKYLMMNLPEKSLEKLEKVTEGLLSPTIMRLDKSGWVAAHMVIRQKETFWIIKKLKGIGARDILVVPIERLVR